MRPKSAAKDISSKDVTALQTKSPYFSPLLLYWQAKLISKIKVMKLALYFKMISLLVFFLTSSVYLKCTEKTSPPEGVSIDKKSRNHVEINGTDRLICPMVTRYNIDYYSSIC